MIIFKKVHQLIELSSKQVKDIKRHIQQVGGTSISAKDFNKIILGSCKTSNNTNYNKTAAKGKKTYEYFFTFHAIKIDDKTYKFTLEGKHLATNEYNSIQSMGRQKAYKDAIKKAVYHYSLIHRSEYKNILPSVPFKKSVLYPTAYNPKSRDDDGCDVTLKYLRDTLTTYKFIEDDKRENLKRMPTEEVISKDYKIELILKSLD